MATTERDLSYREVVSFSHVSVHSFNQSRSQSTIHSNQHGLSNPQWSSCAPGGRDRGVGESEADSV